MDNINPECGTGKITFYSDINLWFFGSDNMKGLSKQTKAKISGGTYFIFGCFIVMREGFQ